MKRYQNPDVFEPLAMAYALGTLQGRARARFETLMARHFYLRVVTEAYEHQFSGLVGLLPPEEPSPEVWQRLESELGLQATQVAEKPKAQSKVGASWLDWFHWPAMALASVFAAMMTFLVMSGGSQPDAYFAKLLPTTSNAESVIMAAVSKKELAITIAMAEQLKITDGVEPVLWCLSKTPGAEPIRMGVVNAAGQTELPISADAFAGLEDVSEFVITLESSATEAVKPNGEKVFAGELMSGIE